VKAKGPFLLVRREVTELVGRFRQLHDDDPEAGGILLGIRKEGGHIEVVSATEPAAGDNRKRYFFFRDSKGHKEKADEAWAASNGYCHYLGEWHSHAEDHPSPSCLDRFEWIKLANQVKPIPLVMVIVGRRGMWVGTADRKSVRESRPLYNGVGMQQGLSTLK